MSLDWILMVGTVVVTAAYSNTTRLGHAYGFCVILVTFITTNLVALVALIVWRLHPLLVLAVYLPLATLDGLFLSSASTKVPEGAWFTLLVAVVLASFFILWRYGKEAQWTAEAEDRISAKRLIAQGPVPEDGSNPKEHLHVQYGGGELDRVKGLGVYFDKEGEGVPASFMHFVQKLETRPDVIVLLHMRAVPMPSVAEEDRYSIAAVKGISDCYRVVVRHGYNDHVVSEELGGIVYIQVRRFLIRNTNPAQPDTADTADLSVPEMSQEERTSASSTATDSIILTRPAQAAVKGPDFELSAIPRSALPLEGDAKLSQRITHLDIAYAKQIVYIVGKEQLRIVNSKAVTTWKQRAWWSEMVGRKGFRRLVLALFLWVRENSRAKVASMKIPLDKLIEVGFVKEM